MNAVLVMGIGNAHRGDDGAGLAVANRLRGLVPEGVTIRTGAPDAAALIEAWDGAALAIVVDAASSGAPPGTLHRVENADGVLPPRRQGSTHGLGLAEAIALGRAVGRLPERLVVYGIEGEDFGMGEALSPPVRATLEVAVGRILEDLARA